MIKQQPRPRPCQVRYLWETCRQCGETEATHPDTFLLQYFPSSMAVPMLTVSAGLSARRGGRAPRLQQGLLPPCGLLGTDGGLQIWLQRARRDLNAFKEVPALLGGKPALTVMDLHSVRCLRSLCAVPQAALHPACVSGLHLCRTSRLWNCYSLVSSVLKVETIFFFLKLD